MNYPWNSSVMRSYILIKSALCNASKRKHLGRYFCRILLSLAVIQYLSQLNFTYKLQLAASFYLLHQQANMLLSKIPIFLGMVFIIKLKKKKKLSETFDR